MKASLYYGLILTFCLPFFSAKAKGVNRGAAALQRELLVVSDIDDTIRTTYTQAKGFDYFEFFKGGVSTSNFFSGMPLLYRHLLCDSWQSCNTVFNSKTIFYVTGAPGLFRHFSENFIRVSGFPLGNIFGRSGLKEPTADFKWRVILQLIQSQPARRILLIGDNSEYDPEVYLKVRQWCQQNYLPVPEIFIHQPYNKPTPASSTYSTFATAGDLATQLYEKGLISLGAAYQVIEDVLVDDHVRRQRVFPEWMRCELWAQNNPRIQLPTPDLRSQRLWQEFTSMLNRQCRNQGGYPLRP